MSVEYYQNLLRSIDSANPEIVSAAALANQYTEMHKDNKITAGALYELLQNLQIQTAIDYESADVESFEILNLSLTGLCVMAAKDQ